MSKIEVNEIDPSSGTTLTIGGDLDTNDKNIITASNRDLNLYPNGTGAVEIGGNTNPGTIILNCEQNSHGIKLQSPPHSANQSYTLKFPSGNVTAGKFLKVDSVSGSGTTGIGTMTFADAGGGYVKLAETNVTSPVASVTLDGYFSTTYDIYRVYFFNVVPVSDNVALRFRYVSGGSVVSSSDYKYLVNGAYSSASSVTTDQQSGSGATFAVIGRHGIDNQDISAGENGYYDIFNPLSTDHQKYASGHSWDSLNDNAYIAAHQNTAKYEANTSALSGVNFFFGTGNIASGTFVMYGLTK